MLDRTGRNRVALPGVYQPGNRLPHQAGRRDGRSGSRNMKSIILWALGVPITVIILLNVFHVL